MTILCIHEQVNIARDKVLGNVENVAGALTPGPTVNVRFQKSRHHWNFNQQHSERHGSDCNNLLNELIIFVIVLRKHWYNTYHILFHYSL